MRKEQWEGNRVVGKEKTEIRAKEELQKWHWGGTRIRDACVAEGRKKEHQDKSKQKDEIREVREAGRTPIQLR